MNMALEARWIWLGLLDSGNGKHLRCPSSIRYAPKMQGSSSRRSTEKGGYSLLKPHQNCPLEMDGECTFWKTVDDCRGKVKTLFAAALSTARSQCSAKERTTQPRRFAHSLQNSYIQAN